MALSAEDVAVLKGDDLAQKQLLIVKKVTESAKQEEVVSALAKVLAAMGDAQPLKINKRPKDDVEESKTESSAPKALLLGAPSSMGDNVPLNLRYLMERGPAVQPDSEILTRIAGGKFHRITYGALQQMARRVACSLRSLGVALGDRVATLMWNNSRHMSLYYAVPAMGAVLHTLNIRLSKGELAFIIKDAGDKVLFVDATLLPLLQQVDAAVLAQLERIIVCGNNEAAGGWKSTLPNTIDFDDFIALGDAALGNFAWPELDERTGAALCYTSGTTGNAKGVMYSHRSCCLETLMLMSTDCMNLSGASSVLPVVPMFHVLSWCTPFSALCLGYKYVLYNCYRAPTDFMDMVVEEQVDVLLGVPTVLNGIKLACQKAEVWAKYGAKLKACWKRAVCGGSAPPPSTIEWFWAQLGCEVIHGWGMTETNPVGSLSRRVQRRCDLAKSAEQRLANQLPQGALVPLMQAKIVRPDNYAETLPNDGEAMGELLVRGPTVCARYYNTDASHKFHDGWLVTGDIASIRADRTLLLRDRSKDLIKSGGEWISSVALENAICALPGVDKAAVVGVQHPKYQERPVAVIQMAAEAKEEEKPSLEAVRKFLGETGNFAKFQFPDDIVFDEIPLTGTGKMSKKGIRQKLEEAKYVLPEFRK